MARSPTATADFDDLLSSDLSSVPPSPVQPATLVLAYPSPPSSQASARGVMLDAEPAQCPPTKRRKVEPKPRTTKHLDLTPGSHRDHPALDLLVKTLQKKKKIVVVAGAGISVSAGIPDFRSSNGLFTALRKDHKLRTSGKELFDISVYQEESTTSSFHDMVRSLSEMAERADRTAFHRLLDRLAESRRLRRLYTQNIDELDTDNIKETTSLKTKVPLESPWPVTIQLHGGLGTMVCQKCKTTSKLQRDRFEGPNPPLCERCHENEVNRTAVGQRSHGVGRLRPRIVLYNERSPDEEAIGSVVTTDLRARPDALIVVGTSMKIPGVRRIVREMCRVVRGRKDGITMWINRDSPPVGKDFEDCWDLVIKGDSDEVARLARLDPSDNEVMEITASDEERIRQQGKPSVVIPIRKSSVSQDKSSMQLNALHPAEVPYRANPASKGRPLSEVIPDRKPGKKPAKPASKRKSKANDQVNKINQTYKVSKSSGTSRTKIDKSAVVKCEDWPKPMVEISSGSPRSNGPMPPKPNDQETISPKGPIPNGMRGLLTIENPAAGK